MNHHPLTLVLLGLAACGPLPEEPTPPAPPLPSLASGQYHVSNVTFSEDGCLLANLPDPLAIDVDSSTITFTDLGSGNVPTGIIAGTNFIARADYQYDNRNDTPSIDCVEHLVKEVRGIIDEDNTFRGRFFYESAVASGNQCSQQYLGYPIPCKSTATFTANRLQ